mmetsp:Transcript_23608/g.59884  ORF Transcript_23608/g.59884 Transcript_23608/m.59884 type:complete len:352 (-) Transcript_23608:126-1181(-)
MPLSSRQREREARELASCSERMVAPSRPGSAADTPRTVWEGSCIPAVMASLAIKAARWDAPIFCPPLPSSNFVVRSSAGMKAKGIGAAGSPGKLAPALKSSTGAGCDWSFAVAAAMACAIDCAMSGAALMTEGGGGGAMARMGMAATPCACAACMVSDRASCRTPSKDPRPPAPPAAAMAAATTEAATGAGGAGALPPAEVRAGTTLPDETMTGRGEPSSRKEPRLSAARKLTSSLISTYATPRQRPDFRSVIRRTSATCPITTKAATTSSRVVEGGSCRAMSVKAAVSLVAVLGSGATVDAATLLGTGRSCRTKRGGALSRSERLSDACRSERRSRSRLSDSKRSRSRRS